MSANMSDPAQAAACLRCAQAGGGGEWSDQETLLLLEGVEAHGEGWPAVAAHVGTKSQLQCAMRFLQVTNPFQVSGFNVPRIRDTPRTPAPCGLTSAMPATPAAA